MLRCPPTVGPFFLLLSPTPSARLAPLSFASPPRRVFPGPPGALWADVLGFDCLVTGAVGSGSVPVTEAAQVQGSGLEYMGCGDPEGWRARSDIWGRVHREGGISPLGGLDVIHGQAATQDRGPRAWGRAPLTSAGRAHLP